MSVAGGLAYPGPGVLSGCTGGLFEHPRVPRSPRENENATLFRCTFQLLDGPAPPVIFFPQVNFPLLSPEQGTSTSASPKLLLKRREASLAQPCPTPGDPVDCSPLGSSIRGMLQARIREWVAIPSSRGILPTQESNPGLRHWQADSLSAELRGKPNPWR